MAVPSAMAETRIIAVETSSATGSVALALGPRLLAERSFSTQTQHARELIPTLAKLHAELGWPTGRENECYLSIGPGSFTGLRVAVTFARHLALATGARLCAVPTLDVIAANALEMISPPSRLAVILDAKRGQVFGATFSLTGEGYCREDEARLIEPAVLLKAGPLLSVIGEGIAYHRAAVEESGATIVDRALWTPRAANVHRLGWALSRAIRFTPPRELTPLYIRRPEAEELWEKRRTGQTDPPPRS